MNTSTSPKRGGANRETQQPQASSHLFPRTVRHAQPHVELAVVDQDVHAVPLAAQLLTDLVQQETSEPRREVITVQRSARGEEQQNSNVLACVLQLFAWKIFVPFHQTTQHMKMIFSDQILTVS